MANTDYFPIAAAADTIASGSSLAPGTTQFLITSGNFGTHTDYYTVDYNNGSREIIEASTNGTTVSVINRGLDNTAQVTHGQGALIACVLTDSHLNRMIKLATQAAIPLVQTSQYTPFTGPLVLTGTQQNVPNTAQTITVTGTQSATVVATAVFDMVCGQQCTMVGVLLVDGTPAPGQAIYAQPTSTTTSYRSTISSNYSFKLTPGVHIIQLAATQPGGTNQCVVNDSHTKLTTTVYMSPF